MKALSFEGAFFVILLRIGASHLSKSKKLLVIFNAPDGCGLCTLPILVIILIKKIIDCCFLYYYNRVI